MSEPSVFRAGSAISELTGLLLSTETVDELLHAVVELSTRAVEPVTTAGLTIRRDDRIFSVATADELAAQLDERQYERDTGPCLDALAAGDVVEAPDLTIEDRWDDYPTLAIGHGIRSVLSTPLVVDDKPVGVLNLYASHPHAFSDIDRQLAELLAGQAAIVITMAQRHQDQVILSENLRIALASRATIDQAIGIVIAQRRCGVEEAFATLRSISQRRNLKLRVVATELVDAMQHPA
jgi:GAF domain-containing protein